MLCRSVYNKGFNSLQGQFSSFNSLPHDKILEWSKLKAFADDKKKKKKPGLKIEICVGKVENMVLLFPLCFQKLSFPEVLKVGIVW